MHNVSEFLAVGKPDAFVRMNREAFLFTLINTINREDCIPEGSMGADYKKQPWLLAEKRRIRNAVIREAAKIAKEWNASHSDKISPDDYQVLARAFFETHYGAPYKNQYSHYWYTDDFKGTTAAHTNIMRDRIAAWDDGTACLVSPYDPMFADSDAFDDEHDQMGYAFFDNVAPDTVMTNVRLYGKTAVTIRDSGTFIKRNKDQKYDMSQISAVNLDGVRVNSGYADIYRYINDKDNAEEVLSFLSRVERSEHPMEAKHKKFMKDVCEYLHGLGLSYTIKVKGGHELIAKLDRGTEVRLWDEEDAPVYQGRVYDQGRTAYLSVYGPNGQGDDLDAFKDKVVTTADRMAFMKWYFGGVPVPVSERSYNGFDEGVPYTGSKARLDLKKGPFVGNARALEDTAIVSSDQLRTTVSRDVKGRSNDGSNIMISYVHTGDNEELQNIVRGGKGTNGRGISEVMISVKYSGTSSSSYDSFETLFHEQVAPISAEWIPVEGELSDGDDEKEAYRFAAWNSFRKNIDPMQILPGDAEKYLTDDGKEALCVKERIPADHIPYYVALSARNMLAKWVDSAMQNHRHLMAFDKLKDDYDAWVADNDYIPASSSDNDVETLRTQYFNFLTGSGDSGNVAQFIKDVFGADDLGADDADSLSYDDRIAVIMAHYQDYLNATFGGDMDQLAPTPEEHKQGGYWSGFNPETVARYVTTDNSHSVQRNYDYIRHMLMMLGDYYDPDIWLPEDNYISNQIKNDLVKYDPNHEIASFSFAGLGGQALHEYANRLLAYDGQNAEIMNNRLLDGDGNILPETVDRLAALSKNNDVAALKHMPVSLDMMMHVARTLVESGCLIDSVKVSIDDKGVIHYEGAQYTKANPKSGEAEASKQIMKGEIGQIFEPDEYGAMDPKYVVPSSDVFVPGYEAFFVPDDPDHPQDIRDRLRLVSWKQQMKQTITRELHNACFQYSGDYSFYPRAGVLNRVYKHMYDISINKQFYEMHLPKKGDVPTPEQQTYINNVKTLALRCHFDKVYSDNATTMAQSYLENPEREESRRFDYYYSDQCNNRNMRVLGPDLDGAFDPTLTGTAKNQGTVLYLPVGIVVNNITGQVQWVDVALGDSAPETPIMMDKLFRNKKHDTWDRVIMAASQVFTAWYTPRDVKVALMRADGYTFDDGMIISKKFADEHPVPVLGTKGLKSNSTERRSLTIQDKLSDLHGNKGVVSFVADPAFLSETIADTLFDTSYNIKTLMGASRAFFNQHPEFVEKEGTIDIKGVGTGYSFKYDPSRHGDYIAQSAIDIQNQMLMRGKGWTDESLGWDDSGRSLPVSIEYNGVKYEVQLDRNSGSSYVEQIVRAIQCANNCEGRDDILRLFRDNPDLEVVMSPDSAMSRANAGLLADIMEKPESLVLNGKTIEGGAGRIDMIVVDMLADVKTHVSDVDDIENHGRKASTQLALALQAKGAGSIMKEFYGSNARAFDDLREYAICVGFDFDEEMRPLIGYHRQSFRDERRRLFKLPSGSDVGLEYVVSGKNAKNRYRLSTSKSSVKLGSELTDEMVAQLNMSGGFMELPFQLDFNVQDSVSKVPYFKSFVEDNPLRLAPTGQFYTDASGKQHPTYGMPVLSSVLRSGHDFIDGTSRPHEYTTNYLDIYRQAAFYVAAIEDERILNDINMLFTSSGDVSKFLAVVKTHIDSLGDVPSKEKDIYESVFSASKKRVRETDANGHQVFNADGTKAYKEVPKSSKDIQAMLNRRLTDLKDVKANCVSEAQSKFDSVVDDIVEHRFSTKYNVIREQVMSKRVMRAGSVVWSADPTLKSDEIALSTEQCQKLFGDKFDPTKRQSILVLRDPVLRDGGVRYFNVVINDNLIGGAVNPLLDISFDGDFDGDSVGIIPLFTSEARKEARQKFSFEANMLDYGKKVTIRDPRTGKTKEGYPLFIQSGQDRAANEVQRDADGNVLFDADGEPLPSVMKDQIDLLEWKINQLEERIQLMHASSNPSEFILAQTTDPKTKKPLVEYKGEEGAAKLRKMYKKDIDKWMSTALKGIGTDHIIVKDAKSVVNSYQRIVDDKAKGSASKMDFLMDNLGIAYDRDPDTDRVDISTVTEVFEADGSRACITRCDASQSRSVDNSRARTAIEERELMNRIQETVAYKADNTSLGGLFLQKGASAFRDTALKELLELTYPITQSILQSKHDPLDAKAKDKIARFWGMDCWNGYKLSGDFGDDVDADTLIKQSHQRILVDVLDSNGNKIPVRELDESTGYWVDKVDANGNPVYEKTYLKCTRDEWIAQMKGMFKAMKVDINSDYIERLADLMCSDKDVPVLSADTGFTVTYKHDGSKQRIPVTQSGYVTGLDAYAKRHGALLDRMGYTEKFSALVYMACMSDVKYRDFVSNEKNSGWMFENCDFSPACCSVAGNAAKASDRQSFTNSALFAPNSFVSSFHNEIQTESNGDTTSVDVESTVKRQPVPIGRSDSRISADEYNSGTAFMGESQKDYSNRIAQFSIPSSAVSVDRGQTVDNDLGDAGKVGEKILAVSKDIA